MSSQEIVQNMVPASPSVDANPQNTQTDSFANLFEDVALVKDYLDCLGMKYDPDHIADLLLGYDSNAERVSLVVNRILDEPPDDPFAASSSSNLAPNIHESTTETNPVKLATKNKSPIEVNLESDDDLAPSPNKLSKSVHPEENPFSIDYSTAKDSDTENEVQRSDIDRVSEITAQFLERVKKPNSTSTSTSVSTKPHSPVSQLANMYENLNNISSITDKYKNSLDKHKNAILNSSFSAAGASEEQAGDAMNNSGPSATITTNSHLNPETSEISQPVEVAKISVLSPAMINGFEFTNPMFNFEYKDPAFQDAETVENFDDKETNDVFDVESASDLSDDDDMSEMFELAKCISKNSLDLKSLNETNTSSIPSSEPSVSTANKPAPSSSEAETNQRLKYLPNLMEIFPDADPDYLRNLCENTGIQVADIHSLQQLIDEVLGNPDYPRKNEPNEPVETKTMSMSPDEMYQNIMAIFPDIDPWFLDLKCKEFTDEDMYLAFINEMLTAQQPPSEVEKQKETSLPVQAPTDDSTTSHSESLAYLKDRYKLIKTVDIQIAFKQENYDMERTCKRLDSHQGALRKTKRSAQECKTSGKHAAEESLLSRKRNWPNSSSDSAPPGSDDLRKEIINATKSNDVQKMTLTLANATLYLDEQNERRHTGTPSKKVKASCRKERLKSFIEKPSKFTGKKDLHAVSIRENLRHLNKMLKTLQSAVGNLPEELSSKGHHSHKNGAVPSSKSSANNAPTLPFEVLEELLCERSVTTDDGKFIRQTAIDLGVVHLILASLAALSHCPLTISLPGTPPQPSSTSTKKTATRVISGAKTKQSSYWATGTGYGTGSTSQSRNVQQANLKQKWEESLKTVVLQVLASFIYPKSTELDTAPVRDLPPLFYQLVEQSCLLTVLTSYLRNDSVLDIARHIPLYRAILRLLLVIASNEQYVQLLLPRCSSSKETICSLLLSMKNCIDSYLASISILMWNKNNEAKSGSSGAPPASDEALDQNEEELTSLIPDIESIAVLIQAAADKQARNGYLTNGALSSDAHMESIEQPLATTVEDRYLEFMKALRFDHFDMIVEDSERNEIQFTVTHHYADSIRSHGDGSHPGRMKRLAQEAVTLQTSLPLSYSSSVFVRCDSDRLDVMKVLITGPAETPYMNGCFEFDVYFPKEYPNAPLRINLETTGRKTVRFNPNLYNCGKVCLSILNTWHGRPEEEWNSQTSSFLQVLVSIQSLILVPEPYFNEPGYEKFRGTPTGTRSSVEYNRNICQQTIRWAMVEQLKNPSPCFKKIIQSHFWMKRNEISLQIRKWMADVENDEHLTEQVKGCTTSALRSLFELLRKELAKLTPPAGLEDLFKSNTMRRSQPVASTSTQPLAGPSSSTS